MATGIDDILVPTDGSAGALAAAAFAGALARAAGAGVTVVMVHSLDIYSLNATGQLTWLGGTDYGALSKQEVDTMVRRNIAEPAFEKTRAAIGTGVSVQTLELWGQAADEICRQARDDGADLIVIGSRGRSAFGELLLGSVSSQVLHHAPCPVCVVR
ncbi:MAG: universal stress protein [Gammaproteobacteria bacterium]|nr:universal stress protein [Gammaproteobacteria bacterium]